MPPVKDFSKLTKEELFYKCRQYNLPVGSLTKSSRTSLERKVRNAMNEELGKKYFDQANVDIKSKEAASEPDTRKSLRPSRIPILIRSHSIDGRTSPRSPRSPMSVFEYSNDSGIQMTSEAVGTNANGFQGMPNQWESFNRLRRSLMEDLKDFDENKSGNLDEVREEELIVSGQLKRQLKHHLKAEFNFNESEDEEEENDGNFNNAENGQQINLFQSKWVSAGLILVTGIILYNIWENLLY